MRRRTSQLWAPSIGAEGSLLSYGHAGTPVLMFPADAGSASDAETNGMVEAVAGLIEGGWVTLYCVDSYDEQSWTNRTIPMEERARRHAAYESWIVEDVVPWIHDDCGGPVALVASGCALGAFHAADITLRHPHLFTRAVCLSGNYDVGTWSGWGERGEAVAAHDPIGYVPRLEGEELRTLREQVNLTLVCGQGRWEATTGALAGTRALAALLAERGIPHELDVWGRDAGHDWPWWRQQFAHHLSRIC
jgi:esterase/lipase superfamily enzyme